jgi:arsenate reductase
MIIFYNPECSKCQAALDILNQNSCAVEIRNYLQIPPTVEELKALMNLLNCKPLDIVRKKETLFVENYEGKVLNDEEVFALLAEHPVLIERPIVIDGQRAVIGRPPELVIDFIRPVENS